MSGGVAANLIKITDKLMLSFDLKQALFTKTSFDKIKKKITFKLTDTTQIIIELIKNIMKRPCISLGTVLLWRFIWEIIVRVVN